MAGPQGDQAREGNRSSGSKSGPSGGHRDRTTSAGRAAGAAGPASRDIERGLDRGVDSGSQRHANRRAEIERVAHATGRSATPTGNTGVSPAGKVSSTQQGMVRDRRNIGNTDVENFGNMVASALGFNEQRPTLERAMARVDRTAPGATIDKRAGWGWDPVGALASAAAPTGLGTIAGGVADYISAAFDRPLEIGLGPEVFSGQISAPTFDPTYVGGNPFSGISNPFGGSPSPSTSNVATASGGGVHPAGGPPTPGQAQTGQIAAPGQSSPGQIAIPGQPQPMAPQPQQAMAPVPGVSTLATPYANAIPMPGQVRLPQNYFMSQMT